MRSPSQIPAHGGERAFRYRAADVAGRVVKGRTDAPDEATARRSLSERGFFVLSIEAEAQGSSRRRAVRRQDLAAVFRSVASLVSVGMPVERALGASEALVRPEVATVLQSVRERIRSGDGVAEALRAQDGAFPPVLVGIVRAGEKGSQLSHALSAAADQLEQEAELRSQVRSALAYPVLILGVGLLSLGVMGGVVVPRFAELLSDMGAALPASTRILLTLGDILSRVGWVVPIALACAAWATAHALKRPAVRRRADAALLRLPSVGPIRHGLASARTCRALSAMLRTGMPLLAALDAAGDATGDLEVAARLAETRSDVARGERLTPSLERSSALSAVALQLVGIGETSGNLAEMTEKAGVLVEARTRARIKTLVAVVEPLLVIVLGAMVALTAAALLQAVYSVRPGL